MASGLHHPETSRPSPLSEVQTGVPATSHSPGIGPSRPRRGRGGRVDGLSIAPTEILAVWALAATASGGGIGRIHRLQRRQASSTLRWPVDRFSLVFQNHSQSGSPHQMTGENLRADGTDQRERQPKVTESCNLKSRLSRTDRGARSTVSVREGRHEKRQGALHKPIPGESP